ncbi:TonB-dependent siderophore receptor [Caulobacter sp.]|uniref:TonB-dependent siderophore receptor n=1 Tax=Caulobacter sp. TaxID=78 RepID=UPI0031CE26DA
MRPFLAVSTAAVALIAANAALAQASAPDAVDALIVTSERATTATKTDTPLIRTPQAVSVVEGQLIADRGALNLQETLRYSAGAGAETYGMDTRGDGPSLRGFSSAQYLDGLNKVIGFNLVPRTEVYTLERVEILRGPSSMLYGQGSTGGVINSISKRPTFEKGGEIVGQVGSFDRFQGMVDYQTPVSDDLAVRLVAMARDAGMQTDHVDDNRVVISPSISWKPTDDTTITLIGLYQDDHTASSQQFLPVVSTLLDRFPRLPVDRFLGEPDYDRLDAQQTAVTLLASHRFNDTFQANANLRFVDAKTEFREIYAYAYGNPDNPFTDAANQIIPRSAYAIDTDTKIVTADFNGTARFATGAIDHVLLGGLDILDVSSKSASGFGMVTSINAYNPVYGQPFDAPVLATMPKLDQSQVGFYLQDQLRWGDLTMVAGFRRDRAEQQNAGSAKQVDKATTYRVGAIYDLGHGVSPYISYSESFQPVIGQNVRGETFKPQKGEQVEVGVKWRPLAGVLVTLAGYDLTETNRLVNDPDNVVNTIQTGEISGKGIEFEASWIRPRDLTVTVAMSHAKTEVQESSADYEEGRQASDTPRNFASAWVVKTLPLDNDVDLRIGGGVRYMGSTTSIGATNTLKTPSNTLVDALLAVDFKRWSLSLNATNLLDKQYYVSCRVFGDCFTGLGRNVIASVGYKF